MSSRLIHGICMYYGQWLPGDERGWRSRDHKRHSSGDYKKRPPADEHAGLRTWVRQHMTDEPVKLRPVECASLGDAFIYKMHQLGARVRCLACAPTHLHVLYDSPAKDAKHELARAKQFSSLKLTTRTGGTWARDCSVEEIKRIEHARRLWVYILRHADNEGAWTWRYDRDEVIRPRKRSSMDP